MEDIKNVTTEDLKGALHLYDLNKRNIKPESFMDIRNHAAKCAAELRSRIGPNPYSTRFWDSTKMDGKV